MPSRREGSITQRSKGSWQIRFYGPPDANGRQKQVNETVHGLRKDAERALRERLAAIENGGFVAKDKETVSQFLARWLETYVTTNTRLRTQHGYRGYVKRYIGPTIGSVPLQSLTASQVQGVYAGMLERGLSTTTVVQLHRIFKEALSHAVKWGVLVRNVADAVSPPKIQRKQMEMWSLDTIHQFLDLADQGRFGDVHRFAVHTGLRRSEICGLKWESVDLTGRRLSVVNTLQRITGHGMHEDQPKTNRSRRSVALAPETVDLLHGVRGRQIERSLDYGPLWQNTGYAFTQIDGSPVAPDMISKDFCLLVRKHGLPHLTFHGLRHANATLAMTAGVNPKVVSETLGHSTVGLTLDLYSHVTPNMQEEAAQAVANLLRRPPLQTAD